MGGHRVDDVVADGAVRGAHHPYRLPVLEVHKLLFRPASQHQFENNYVT